MARKMIPSMYKGGHVVTFVDKRGRCHYSLRRLSKETGPHEVASQDFQVLWEVLQKLAIVEPDMTLASLEYLIASENSKVIFRFHDFSTRTETPPQLKNAVADIIEQYLPEYNNMARELREG